MNKESITAKYNFLNFDDILKKIRNSFLEEMESLGIASEIRFNSRLHKKILRHCVLTEILSCYTIIDLTKTNVIIIQPAKNCINSCGTFDEAQFLETVIVIIDSCKRKIPILIKKYHQIDDFDLFLNSGDGQQFLTEIDGDRERLRKTICTFKEFKVFAKENGLRYIVETLLNDVQFKKLFVS